MLKIPIISGPRHDCSPKVSENHTFPEATQGVKGMIDDTANVEDEGHMIVPERASLAIA